MAVCCPWRYGITLILAVALLAIAVAAPRVSAAPGRALSAAQLSRRILSQSAATTQPLPDEQLPQGFATAKLPSEKVSISLLVKGTTEEQFKSGSLEKRLLSVTSNVTGIPADEWATTVANGPAPAVKPKPKEAPKVNRTVPANTTKHAATPAAAPKPATKARGTEESAIAPIPKPAEKEVKPSTAIPESSSKPQAKKTPVPAAAVLAPAAAASTKDVIIAGAQCGGRGGECSSKPDYKCADAAFAGYSCAAGYVCKRENEWYWHCDTDSSSAAAKSADPFTVGAYEQCGGQGGVCSGKSCADAVFPGYKCTLGYTCARQNEWYWQCVEEAGATASGGGRKLLQQVQRVSRSLQQQQQQQQAAPGDLEVNLSILTDNPQLVIYRLSKAATAADASGCTTQYCSELAAAGVPIDSRSVQVTPTLAAVTAQVAHASSTSSNPRLAAAASPAEPSLQVQQPQQQSGTSNGKLIGGIIGGVVGGILLLVLLVLGGRRLMSRRHKVPAAEKESKDVYLDQAPVSPVVTQSRDFHSEGPTEAVAEVVKDPAMLQIRTSFSDFDIVKAAATTDQDPTPGPRFLAAAAAADAAAAGSSAAAAADGDAAQPRSARNSFNFVPKIARSFSFTNMLPGRKSTAAAADADVLVEPQTPEVEGTRADRSESAEHSPLAFPAAPEDDEHHDDFDPHHSARNSFHSRRNSFANRRSFGDSLYRSGSRNSGEYNAYRRGMNSYTSWASGAVPTAADLAAAVQKNVNSRRSFQKQRGPKATASTTPPGASTSKARRALHHSHSASDLTTRYTSSSAAAAGAASPAAAAAATPAAAPAGAEDMPLSSFPISNVASGTTTPTSSAAFLGGVGLSPVGMGSHAISGLTSGCATPSSVASGAVSVLGRPGDVVISRSDAILTSHALAGLRSTGNTPAPSVAGSLARGSTGSQGFPLNSYALPGLASGYNTPGGSVAGPLSRVSYNSVAGIGPRGYPISALPSGCVTPSSFYAGAVGSMTAGSHSHTLAPSVVAHALAGLESGYNTPAVSVAGSLARMSAGSEAYGGYHLNSHAIAGLASGAVTPSDRASVYSSAWVGMPIAAALAATDDNIVGGVPIDSHALSGLASGATTPGAAINAAAEAAAAGSGEGVLLFNAHALSNVHSGVSTPTSRRSLSTLSVHSDAEYALYRRGLSSYNMWLNESNNEAEAESAAAAATTAAATTAATTATATPTENAAGENAAANSAGQQITSGPTGYALSIASGYSSPKSAAPVALGRAGPMFTSHALSDMGSGTMTPYSMSTYSAYANQAYDGAALREHRQMVDPAQLNQALSRYYSSVEGVVVSQPVSRRNSTSSVVPEMPRLAE